MAIYEKPRRKQIRRENLRSTMFLFLPFACMLRMRGAKKDLERSQTKNELDGEVYSGEIEKRELYRNQKERFPGMREKQQRSVTVHTQLLASCGWERYTDNMEQNKHLYWKIIQSVA
ncbi:hypothetical protein TNCV_4968511 [Trichonephila clavipes]|nr:hypothetical protein TNCV_4968511 [Trichonephila clavipes]